MEAVRPKFDRPPLIEQAITVVFDELPGFSIGDFGLFWSEIREEFPACDRANPLQATIEQLPAKQPTADIRLLLAQELPLPRAMYRGASGELIQIQSDRFTFNWAKIGDTPYPHSEQTTARFLQLFKRFQVFASSRGFSQLNLIQCEITNVNIVPVRDFGKTFADAGTAFRVADIPLDTEILQRENFVQTIQHLILEHENPVGRLYAVLQPVVNAQDGLLAYRLELTARSGRRVSWDLSEVCHFFDLARSAINSAFLAYTTPLMWKLWGRNDGH